MRWRLTSPRGPPKKSVYNAKIVLYASISSWCTSCCDSTKYYICKRLLYFKTISWRTATVASVTLTEFPIIFCHGGNLVYNFYHHVMSSQIRGLVTFINRFWEVMLKGLLYIIWSYRSGMNLGNANLERSSFTKKKIQF